jgi:hypothetical protein
MKNHIITPSENSLLFDYFKNEQDEEIEDVTGKTIEEASIIIGPEDFEEETEMHIHYVLFNKQIEY